MKTVTAAALAAAGLLVHTVATGSMESQCGAPPGTVIAFAGERVPPYWMVADGRALEAAEYPELFAAIGTAHGGGYDDASAKVGDFNLPDLRGQFLRGADVSETGAPSGRDAPSERFAARSGGNAAGVGTLQTDATRLPRTPFHTDTAIPHRHDQVAAADERTCCSVRIKNGNHASGPNQTAQETRPGGAHAHALRGGDRETRPTNVAVRFLICAR
ncbi:MAG TPA: phage tail protein [Longimicrobium sp.]|nr:phage tail protein [Longimicrobium sp.]